MHSDQIITALAATTTQSVRHWIYHLGAWGFIPLGLLDASIIPVPGSMDLLTVVLSARDGHWWFYFALMATAGSVLGGFVTYRLARKGGEETLARKFSPRQLERVHKIFHRSGFAAIAVPAVLPPPTPMILFLFAAGAMQYPVRRFLAALTAGRLVRYTILAYIGQRYGRHVLRIFSQHVTLVVVGGIAAMAIALFFTIRKK